MTLKQVSDPSSGSIEDEDAVSLISDVIFLLTFLLVSTMGIRSLIWTVGLVVTGVATSAGGGQARCSCKLMAWAGALQL